MPYQTWSHLTSADIAEGEETRVAILPLGALEQHGPHMPLGTDAILAQEMALRAAQASHKAQVVLMPLQSYAGSVEHHDWPGTVWIEAEELVALMCAIGRGVALAGIRKLVILNAHGGNQPALQIAARRLRKDFDLFCVTAGWMVLGVGDFDPNLRKGDIHAGFLETSALLHLRPELVDMQKAADFTPASEGVAEANTYLRLMGVVNTGWLARDMHGSGAAGRADKASAEAGRLIVETAATRLGVLLDEVAAHEPPWQGDRS